MSLAFTPPISLGRPLTAGIKRSHPAYSLFRYYAPSAAGQNFWIIDGALTTVEPDPNVSLGQNDIALLGSHITPVTTAQAAIITAAGYGAYLVTIPDVVGGGFTDPVFDDPGLDVFNDNFEEFFA